MPATQTPYRGFNGNIREVFAFCAKGPGARGEILLRHADLPAPPTPAQGDHAWMPVAAFDGLPRAAW